VYAVCAEDPYRVGRVSYPGWAAARRFASQATSGVRLRVYRRDSFPSPGRGADAEAK
jgi:hypothetical protein